MTKQTYIVIDTEPCAHTTQKPPKAANLRKYWLWSALAWQSNLMDARLMCDENVLAAREGCVKAWNKAGKAKALLCC